MKSFIAAHDMYCLHLEEQKKDKVQNQLRKIVRECKI